MKQTYSDFKILSGSVLKLLAILIMAIDHTAAYWLRGMSWCREPWFALGHREISLYVVMRLIGRLAFPIFAFLIVEGFLHTRNRWKYGRNLLLFAVLSEIPWNLVSSDRLFYSGQNVFFTLFFGYLGLCALEKFQSDSRCKALSLLGLLLLSIVFRADYGCAGFGFILMLYLLRNDRLTMAVTGCCFLTARWIAGLAFIPICMYNGRRGFIQGAFGKYLFYLFYPLHLLALYLLRHFIAG